MPDFIFLCRWFAFRSMYSIIFVATSRPVIFSMLKPGLELTSKTRGPLVTSYHVNTTYFANS